MGVAAVEPERGGEVDRPGPAQHANGQVAQAGHDLRAVPDRTWEASSVKVTSRTQCSSGSRVSAVCQAPSGLTARASRTTWRWAVLALLPGVVVDGGVVDQDVQAAVAAVQVGGYLLDTGRVGDLQAPGQHLLVPGQGGGGPLGLGEIAGGEDDGIAAQGQLAGQLAADAAVGPGDQHNRHHRAPRSGGGALLVIGGLPACEQHTRWPTAVWCSMGSLIRCGGVP